MALNQTKAKQLAAAAESGDLRALGTLLRDLIAIQPRIVVADQATLAVDPALHDGATIVLNRAAGVTATLPVATGSGAKYRFVVGTTVTSNSDKIQVTGDDTMDGNVFGAADGGATVNAWECAADSDTITLNGGTTGGIVGDVIEVEDIAADVWRVSGLIAQTGIEATPFSAAVS